MNAEILGIEATGGEGTSDLCKVKALSRLDSVSPEPALVHFESVLDPFASRADARFHVGVEWMDFLKGAIRGEVADIQGNTGVAHPKAALFGPWIDKKHTVIGRQRLAEHQAPGGFRLRDGELNLDRVVSQIEGKVVGFGKALGRRADFRGSLRAGCEEQVKEKEGGGENLLDGCVQYWTDLDCRLPYRVRCSILRLRLRFATEELNGNPESEKCLIIEH